MGLDPKPSLGVHRSKTTSLNNHLKKNTPTTSLKVFHLDPPYCVVVDFDHLNEIQSD